MKFSLPLLLSVILFYSCNLSDHSNKEAMQQGIDDGKATKERLAKEQQKKQERKLRYLAYSNGGLVGYFDDGTVAGCPRCDLLKENVEALYTTKPFDTYTLEKDGHLKRAEGDNLLPQAGKGDSPYTWAMIDYKWIVHL